MNYYILYNDDTIAGPFPSMAEAEKYEKSSRFWYKIWNNKYSVIYFTCRGPLEATK